MLTHRVAWICLAAALLCGAGCAEGIPLPLAEGRTTPEEFLARVRGGNCGEITYELRGSTLTATGYTSCHRDLVEWLADQRALTQMRRGK